MQVAGGRGRAEMRRGVSDHGATGPRTGPRVGHSRRCRRRDHREMLAVHCQPGVFGAAECAEILARAAAAPLREAKLVGRRRDHALRRADLVWLDDIPGTDWMTERLVAAVRGANRAIFGFALDAFAESPQVARYDAARRGHFGWHADIGEGPVAGRRKLTLVVQLSEPDAYAGGALEIWRGAAAMTAPRTQGAAVVFPGFLPHRVTPVTRGARQSLTVWAHGPAFR